MTTPDLTLTRTRLLEGVWEGVLSVATSGNFQPEVRVTHLEKPLEGVELRENPDGESWALRVPIPPEALSDGVQTFLIEDARTGARLGSFALLAGDALDEDIRAEIDLLRAELDMLKRAFRRHCVETAGDG